MNTPLRVAAAAMMLTAGVGLVGASVAQAQSAPFPADPCLNQPAGPGSPDCGDSGTPGPGAPAPGYRLPETTDNQGPGGTGATGTGGGGAGGGG